MVALGELDEVMGGVVSQGCWIRLWSLGRDGHLLVGCPSFLHSAQGGLTCDGGEVAGSFFFRLPLAVAGVLVSGSVGGMVGVSMGIYIGVPSIWGGRDG